MAKPTRNIATPETATNLYMLSVGGCGKGTMSISSMTFELVRCGHLSEPSRPQALLGNALPLQALPALPSRDPVGRAMRPNVSRGRTERYSAWERQAEPAKAVRS